MLFNSLTFVVFFVVVVTAYWSIHSWAARKNLLVTASYIFYGAWNPPFAVLLFSTTAMDFWLGRQIARAKDRASRARWLVASVCMNLSMLGFFKYGNFLLENFQWLMARIGIIYHPPHLDTSGGRPAATLTRLQRWATERSRTAHHHRTELPCP